MNTPDYLEATLKVSKMAEEHAECFESLGPKVQRLLALHMAALLGEAFHMGQLYGRREALRVARHAGESFGSREHYQRLGAAAAVDAIEDLSVGLPEGER